MESQNDVKTKKGKRNVFNDAECNGYIYMESNKMDDQKINLENLKKAIGILFKLK